MDATLTAPKDEREKFVNLGRIQGALLALVQRYCIILSWFHHFRLASSAD